METFSPPPRAGKRVHQFSHKPPSLVGFDGTFGEDHVSFIVQARVRATGVNIFIMIDTVMMNQLAGNDASA